MILFHYTILNDFILSLLRCGQPKLGPTLGGFRYELCFGVFRDHARPRVDFPYLLSSETWFEVDVSNASPLMLWSG